LLFFIFIARKKEKAVSGKGDIFVSPLSVGVPGVFSINVFFLWVMGLHVRKGMCGEV